MTLIIDHAVGRLCFESRQAIEGNKERSEKGPALWVFRRDIKLMEAGNIQNQ
jgi:hypothetical protein